jgi:hypothetical protein
MSRSISNIYRGMKKGRADTVALDSSKLKCVGSEKQQVRRNVVLNNFDGGLTTTFVAL